ncbi:MAG: amidohydrolase family protein [Pseudomonadota bacterium]
MKFFFVSLLAVAACTSNESTHDADGSPDPSADDTIAGDDDVFLEDIEAADTGMDMDMDEEDDATYPSPPAEVLRTGTEGLLLRGTVLTPSGVLDPGDVLISGAFITCVDSDCSGAPGAGEATWIETNGIISPGLIDPHNHIAYNFLPEYIPEPLRTFENRYDWSDLADYEAHIEPYAAHRSAGTHYCPGAKWGELRSLVHATTTVQGESFAQLCVNWGVRNADHFHNLGYDHMRTTIASVRDINDEQAQNYIDSFNESPEPVTRFAVHMAEGYTGNYVTEEFDSFAGRDPRENRHQGESLLIDGTSILIHSIPLTEAQLAEALVNDAKIAWSPSSNLALYGVTAPIQRILQLGITTGLGPDWTLNGEKNMLGEMRFALDYARTNSIPEITPQKLWEMSTWEGAMVVGLEDYIGRLEAGYRADIAVFGRLGADPYRSIVDSRSANVRLVLLDGEGLYGDEHLMAATAANEYCEPLDACSADKYLCVQESPTASDRKNETLADIRTQLFNILEGVGYPPEEQYGRGDELLELIDCGE